MTIESKRILLHSLLTDIQDRWIIAKTLLTLVDNPDTSLSVLDSIMEIIYRAISSVQVKNVVSQDLGVLQKILQ